MRVTTPTRSPSKKHDLDEFQLKRDKNALQFATHAHALRPISLKAFCHGYKSSQQRMISIWILLFSLFVHHGGRGGRECGHLPPPRPKRYSTSTTTTSTS